MKPDSNDNNACTPEGKTKRAQQACTASCMTSDSDPLAFFKAMMEKAHQSADPRSKFKAMLAEAGIDPDSDPLALVKAMMEQHYKSTDPHCKFKARLAKAGIDPDSDPLTFVKAMMEQHYKSTDPHCKFKARLAEAGIDPDSDPLALVKAMMEQHYKSADPRSNFKAKLAAVGIDPDKDIVQEQFAQIIALLDPKREFIDMLSDRPTARSLLHAWFTKSSKSTDPNDIAEAKSLLAEAGIDPDSTTFDEFLEQYYKSRAPHSAPEKYTDPDSPKD